MSETKVEGNRLSSPIVLAGNVDFTSHATYGISGTATNDNAAAGDVGEYVSSTSGDVSSTGTGQMFDVTSISLTAGDWDVSAIGYGSIGSSTSWTGSRLGISTTSGNSTSGLVEGDNLSVLVWTAGSTPIEVMHIIPSYRMSLSATTTVYLKARESFSDGSTSALGRISARRVR
jgi:hypothetical protein